MAQPRLQYYEDEAGEWRFRLLASNGEIILPPEGFSNFGDCKHIAEKILRGDYRVAIELSERLPNKGQVENKTQPPGQPHPVTETSSKTVAIDAAVAADVAASTDIAGNPLPEQPRPPQGVVPGILPDTTHDIT